MPSEQLDGEHAERRAQLPLGTRVRLYGLASKPELNGAVGVVEGFAAKTGRYGVRVAGRDLLLALKPASLAILPELRTAADVVTLWLVTETVPIYSSDDAKSAKELGLSLIHI